MLLVKVVAQVTFIENLSPFNFVLLAAVSTKLHPSLRTSLETRPRKSLQTSLQTSIRITESFLIWLVRRCHVGKTSAAGGTSAARRGVVKTSAAGGVGPGGGAVGSIISKRSCSVFICCM